LASRRLKIIYVTNSFLLDSTGLDLISRWRTKGIMEIGKSIMPMVSSLAIAWLKFYCPSHHHKSQTICESQAHMGTTISNLGSLEMAIGLFKTLFMAPFLWEAFLRPTLPNRLFFSECFGFLVGAPHLTSDH
jgi:hypothetical protein